MPVMGPDNQFIEPKTMMPPATIIEQEAISKVQESLPVPTLYIRNLNDKIKPEGKFKNLL
jgi:hypothetical protein